MLAGVVGPAALAVGRTVAAGDRLGLHIGWSSTCVPTSHSRPPWAPASPGRDRGQRARTPVHRGLMAPSAAAARTLTCVIDPEWWQLGLAGLAVLAGAMAVRTTGMGFALLSSPFLVMALGPFEGILVTNVCGIVAALLNLWVVHADLDWRRAAKVVPAGLVGTLPGALLVLWLPSAVLAIAVSLLVITGLLFTILSRSLQVPNSVWVGAAGGFASGLMNVTAGVGGPGLVVYALATRWEHRSFAATAQLHFAVLGAAALLTKWSLPSLPVIGWAALMGLLVAGLISGNVLARWVHGPRAMRWVIVIAMAGALISLTQGFVQL